MTYIGLDPGKNGGIAAVSRDGAIIMACKMPETEQDILDVLHDLTVGGDGCRAALERVNAGIFGAGKVGRMGVTSAFTFGRGYGGLRMALMASKIPFEEPQPNVWQRALSCLSKGDKNLTKRRAQELFPAWRKITLATADAILIAEYCRRTHGGRDV